MLLIWIRMLMVMERAKHLQHQSIKAKEKVQRHGRSHPQLSLIKTMILWR